jgi:hypothetical protein
MRAPTAFDASMNAVQDGRKIVVKVCRGAAWKRVDRLLHLG